MTREWARYWRSPDGRLEAMHAHFERHSYHRHSHETYSFGVTEQGAQAFSCRGADHISAAGMVMTFNPDDPHDGRAADALGFTYRMVHLGPDLVAEVLDDLGGRQAGLPLFAEPVVQAQPLAHAVRALHRAMMDKMPALQRDERLAAAVASMVRFGAGRPVRTSHATRTDAARIAARAREFLDEAFASDVTAADLATATRRSRYAVYRAFHATYGLAPSDYQRQLRLRAARALLEKGRPVATVAAEAGFADQAHLTRWFTRHYGITPGTYRDASGPWSGQ